ncbi:MAG: PAS domain S-box protein, partial [Caldilineaceae bacterium]|nr:PAS domain S-box protein [Caldilineaceae bacterium]
LYSDYNEPVGGVIINRDITAEKKLSILQERVQSVLELATMGAVLDTVLNELVLAIEEYQPQTSASILLLDVKTGQLRHGAAPNLPDSYITAVDGTVIGPNVGSCGTAAYEKRLVIVDDIETDPLWADYKALALAHGLRACWSQPVINQKGEVLATLAMYYDKIRKPAAEELAVIKLAARIAGLAIEHVQTVTALQESEEKYRTLVESSEAVIVVLNEGGDIQFANKITAAHLGMASDAIVGRNMYDFFPADTVDHNLTLVREVMRTGKGVVHESLMPVAGQNYWYRTSIQPIKNATEKISTVLVHASDITQSKAAEAAIRRNEERYRQMFELVKLPKLINDPHTAQILDANPAAVEFYGYPLETLKTMTMLQINIAEPEVVLEKMGQILARKLDRCDSTQRLADGTIREVEGFAVGIEHEGKEALYCTYIDVTERNRARATLQDANRLLEQRVQERTKALEQSRDRIEAIFNHSGDGILLLDANLQIEQANYSFEQTFATTPADYIGQPLVTFISGEDHTVVEGQIPAVVTQHQTKRIEVQSRRQDGTVFDAEISIAPINRSDNAVRNIVCIIRDITERKQIEAERQKYMAEIEDL